VVFAAAFYALFNVSIYPVAAVVGASLFWFGAAPAHVCAANRRPSGSLVVVTRRIVWKHVKLALTFGIGFLIAIFAIMSILGEAGAYSKSMTIYGKGPELEKHRSFSGKVWHEVASLLAPFALLICILSSSVQDFYLAHLTPCDSALFCLYLVWLWVPVDGPFFIAVDFWRDTFDGTRKIIPFKFTIGSVERS